MLNDNPKGPSRLVYHLLFHSIYMQKTRHTYIYFSCLKVLTNDYRHPYFYYTADTNYDMVFNLQVIAGSESLAAEIYSSEEFEEFRSGNMVRIAVSYARVR